MAHFTHSTILLGLALSSLWFIETPAQAQAQNLVQNPGFETGDFTDWTVVSPRGDTIVRPSTTSIPAHSGNYYVNFGDFTGFGSISQTLSTVSGQQYILSYWLANYPNPNNGATPNEFRVTVGGTLLSDVVNVPYQPYQEYTDSFVATGPSTILQLAGENTPYALQFDDVSVTPTSSVPEVSTLATALLGVLPLAFLLLRCQRQAR
jgi:hypothetical protein